MLTYRRKENSGKMHLMGRAGGSKQRIASHKILNPGDVMIVSSEKELPGFPHAMDGWELINSEPAEKEPPKPVRKVHTVARRTRIRTAAV